MSHTTTSVFPRTTCAVCGKDVAVDPVKGIYSQHGPRDRRCPASRLTEEQARAFRPEGTPQLQCQYVGFLKRHWQIGDAKPVAKWLGLTYVPTTAPTGLDAEQYLAFLVADARDWINRVYKRIYGTPNVWEWTS